MLILGVSGGSVEVCDRLWLFWHLTLTVTRKRRVGNNRGELNVSLTPFGNSW